jgi:tripartite-type tricarboxylate transporter receptor subunit TctC
MGVAQETAASYPSKPVTVIIPFVPGGSTEPEARLYLDKLQLSLKQPFVMEFKPGAATSIAATFLLNSKPDGYTIMIPNTGLTVFPNFYPKLNHQVVSTLTPIVELSNRTTAIIASVAGLPKVNNLRDLEAYGKANSGKLTCNTAGAGGITHIVCAGLANAIGAPIVPVHYKGVAQGQVDLIAGRTQVSGGTLLAAIGQIKAGKLKALAVFGDKRSPLLPDVPTVIEQKYDVQYPSWFGVVGPPKMSGDIVNKLNAEFNAALKSPDVVATLNKLGAEPIGGSPEAFRKKFQEQLVYWKKIIETNKITLAE